MGSGGSRIIISQNFCRKLLKNDHIWTEREGEHPSAPSLGSAKDSSCTLTCLHVMIIRITTRFYTRFIVEDMQQLVLFLISRRQA